MVKVEGLRKRFGSHTTLDGVSFRVAPREIYSYLGPKVTGKITTIRILMGLTHRSEGALLKRFQEGRNGGCS